MNAMAEAVENSEFVIMCMSDAYKQSTYCQAEAEYAFNCKRRLLPLIMRRGYRPDGWLGFLVGSRLYIDFGRFDFKIAVEKLLNEISLQKEQSTQVKSPIPTEQDQLISITVNQPNRNDTSRRSSTLYPLDRSKTDKNLISSVIKARQSTIDFVRKPINQWSESDVADFLKANRLNPLVPICESLNGRGLIELFKLCSIDRLQAYRILKEDLSVTDRSKLTLPIYSQFLTATEDAMKLVVKPSLPSVNTHQSNEIPTIIPFLPAPSTDYSYDFCIESNASPLETLKMVERFGSQLQILDSLRRRMSNNC